MIVSIYIPKHCSALATVKCQSPPLERRKTQNNQNTPKPQNIANNNGSDSNASNKSFTRTARTTTTERRRKRILPLPVRYDYELHIQCHSEGGIWRLLMPLFFGSSLSLSGQETTNETESTETEETKGETEEMAKDKKKTKQMNQLRLIASLIFIKEFQNYIRQVNGNANENVNENRNQSSISSSSSTTTNNNVKNEQEDQLEKQNPTLDVIKESSHQNHSLQNMDTTSNSTSSRCWMRRTLIMTPPPPPPRRSLKRKRNKDHHLQLVQLVHGEQNVEENHPEDDDDKNNSNVPTPLPVLDPFVCIHLILYPPTPTPNSTTTRPCNLYPERLWTRSLVQLENTQIRLQTLNAYIATLGGGYFLCHYLSTAVQLARSQRQVALALGDETLALKCTLNEAYNFIYSGHVSVALGLIRQVKVQAKRKLLGRQEEEDRCLILAMCKSARWVAKKVLLVGSSSSSFQVTRKGDCSSSSSSNVVVEDKEEAKNREEKKAHELKVYSTCSNGKASQRCFDDLHRVRVVRDRSIRMENE